MLVKIEKLLKERLEEFFNYCRSLRGEVASGTIQEEDLEAFTLADNPTYLLLDEKNLIKGAISLILDDYSINNKEGYLRLFHSDIPKRELYEELLIKIKQEVNELNNLYLFIRDDDEITGEILGAIGFDKGGYSYTMVREKNEIIEPVFPEGFQLRDFKRGQDEEAWCTIRNIGFAENEGVLTPEVFDMYFDETYLEGGMKILYHKEIPVGTIRIRKVSEEANPYAYIGTLCIIPEYRGMGLARNLLRVAIKFGRENNLPNAELEVSLQNKHALSLYIDEGFVKVYGMISYKYSLPCFE